MRCPVTEEVNRRAKALIEYVVEEGARRGAEGLGSPHVVAVVTSVEGTPADVWASMSDRRASACLLAEALAKLLPDLPSSFGRAVLAATAEAVLSRQEEEHHGQAH